MLGTSCSVFWGVPSVALDALYIQQMVPSVEVRLTLALRAFLATYLTASLFVQVPKYLLCRYLSTSYATHPLSLDAPHRGWTFSCSSLASCIFRLYSLPDVLQIQKTDEVFELLPGEILREPISWHLRGGYV